MVLGEKDLISSVCVVLEVGKYQLCHVNIPSCSTSLGLLTGSQVPCMLCDGNNRAKEETQHWQVSPGDSDESAFVIKNKHLHQDADLSWFFKNKIRIHLQFYKARIKSSAIYSFLWSHTLLHILRERDEYNQGCQTRDRLIIKALQRVTINTHVKNT